MEIIAMDKGCYIGHNVRAYKYAYITASETHYVQGHSSDWHYHQNPHYSHILFGGSQEVSHNGTKFQHQGEGLYYYPGIAHQNIHYKADTKIFNLEIDKAFFEKHQLAMPSEAWMFSKDLHLNTSGLVKILKEYLLRDEQSELAIDQLTVELVAGSASKTPYYPEWAEKIRPLLQDSWNKKISLHELAGMLDIHPVTLSKYFSKYFHCTLGEYRRRIKVEKAISLIRCSKYSLTEIAYLCEFSDQAHFTKTFRHITGFLPKQYKAI